jgi:ATP-dependent DNA helicase RecG
MNNDCDSVEPAMRIDRAWTWDLCACVGATLDDLTLNTFLHGYLPLAVSAEVLEANGRSTEEKLGSLRMYSRKFAAPTNAAILLFGKDPLYFVPGAFVQFVRYDGPTRADPILAEQRATGTLVEVMRELDALTRQLEARRPVRTEGLTERQEFDYPAVALHELFMNAVIHRNYDGSTTPIMISQFSDRIEVSNPGSLYGDLSRAEFPHGTAYRNPVIAEAAKVLGFANRFGRGVAIANALLKANSNPPVEFIIGESTLVAIVRKRT